MNTMTSTKNTNRLRGIATGLCAILALACLLRVGGALSGGLWLDEFQTYWLSSGEGFGSVLERCAAQMTQFPLFYLVIHASLDIFGPGEWALRWFSVACGVAGVLLVFLLSRRLFSTRDGLMAATIAALASAQIDLSVWARPYALLILLSLAATLCYLRWLESPRWGRLALYAATCALMGWTHILALPFFCVHAAHVILCERRRAVIMPLLGAQLAAGICLLPLAGQVLALKSHSAAFTYGQASPRLIPGYIERYLQSDVHMIIVPALLAAALVLFLIGRIRGATGSHSSMKARESDANGSSTHRTLTAASSYGLLAIWVVVIAGLPALVFWLFGLSLLSDARYFALLAAPLHIVLARLITAATLPLCRAAWVAPVLYAILYLVIARLPVVPARPVFHIPRGDEIRAGITEAASAGLGGALFRTEPCEDWRGAVRDLDEHGRDGQSVYVFTGYVESNLEEFVADPLLRHYLHGPLGGFYSERAFEVQLLPPDPFNAAHQILWREALARETGTFWMLGRKWPGFREAVITFQRSRPFRAQVAPLTGREEGYDGDLLLLRCSLRAR